MLPEPVMLTQDALSGVPIFAVVKLYSSDVIFHEELEYWAPRMAPDKSC